MLMSSPSTHRVLRLALILAATTSMAACASKPKPQPGPAGPTGPTTQGPESPVIPGPPGDVGQAAVPGSEQDFVINVGDRVYFDFDSYDVRADAGPVLDAQASWLNRYPGVRAFMDRTREQARERGWVETVFGRRLQLPEIGSRNANQRAGAERAAINAPMQGTAADIIKRAMRRVHDWLLPHDGRARMLMQVHDELVFEADAGFVDTLIAEVRGLMQGAAELRVPLIVDAGEGENWDEAH